MLRIEPVPGWLPLGSPYQELRVVAAEAPVDMEFERSQSYPAEDYLWKVEITSGQGKLLNPEDSSVVVGEAGEHNRFQRFFTLSKTLLNSLPKEESLKVRVFRTGLKDGRTVCVFGRRIVVE